MNQYGRTFDLKIDVGHCDLYLWSSDFVLQRQDNLMSEHHTFGF